MAVTAANRVFVVGVGMTKFEKPGRREGWDYPEMAKESGTKALEDAGVDFAEIEEAYVGYVYGESTAGERAVYELGMTGIPISNVNNNCSTGSTALYLARQMVEMGAADCVLAVGFEQMLPGALGMTYNDRKRTLDKQLARQAEIQGWDETAPMAAKKFGGGGLEYQARHGASDEAFGLISVTARRHAANNPLAVFRDPLTLEEVMASKHLYGPITRFQACPPTCGAAGRPG